MMTRFFSALGLVVLAASPALADQAAAGKCAAGLAPDAKAIYTAAAPQFAASTDPRGLLKDTTRSLITAGTVSMGNARSAAEAAAACLKLLK